MAVPAEGFTRGVGFGDSLTKGNTSPNNGVSYTGIITTLNASIQCVKRGVSGRTLQTMAAGSVFADEVASAGCGPNLINNSEFYTDVSGWTPGDAESILSQSITGANIASMAINNTASPSGGARGWQLITGLSTIESYVFSMRRLDDVGTENCSYFAGSSDSGASSIDQLGSFQSSGFNSRSFTPTVTDVYFQFQNATSGANEETRVTEAEVREDLPPEFVFMPAGVNDAYAGRTGAQMAADRDIIIVAALAANIEPILATISPTKGFGSWTQLIQDEIDIYNANTLALQPTRTVIDNASLFVDPSNADTLNPIYDAGDGLHWNPAGQTFEASSLLSVISVSAAPTLTTPYSSTIYQVGNGSPRSSSSLYAYLNPNNTIAEATATDWFDGVTNFDILTGDLMFVQMSDGFQTLKFTTPTTAEIA